eukprot:Gregarina_sp_Pseudo_9__1401@NODE_1938_length_1244_cov_173_268050_g949_i1_p1_GENE_NODE_1938_length_1244_cov_173_268050_g949_i1NODE_1938_length_1244_cov_173_268050_g949_i1_p1_ORF_typecomplete_len265_score79_27P5CR_dimer/PF14748_6/3_2e32F420_oxidored/PF03807_17/2_3e10_NODE_1938_length_1244_cov_173_268050_g949_i13321126
MMGQALLGGCCRSGAVSVGNGWAADPYTDFEKVDFVKEFGIHCTRDNKEAIAAADVVFLALKPFLAEGVLNDFYATGGSFQNKLVVSLMSSVSLERLQTWITDTTRVIRIMPNTPALVNAGATAICVPSHIDKQDVDLVKHLMDGCGKSWVIPEKRMNVWTATAGCGPAYMFEILEAYADAAVVGGIPRDIANEMASQLMMGTAKMAGESKQHFGQLKDNVCSPNGPTIVGLQKMRELGVQGSMMMTVEAARRRYDEVEKDPSA